MVIPIPWSWALLILFGCGGFFIAIGLLWLVDSVVKAARKKAEWAEVKNALGGLAIMTFIGLFFIVIALIGMYL